VSAPASARHAAHYRDAAPGRRGGPVRGRAHPPAHRSQGDLRDLRAPGARLPSRPGRPAFVPGASDRLRGQKYFCPSEIGTELHEGAQKTNSVTSVHCNCPLSAKLKRSSLSSIPTGGHAPLMPLPLPEQQIAANSDDGKQPDAAHVEWRACRSRTCGPRLRRPDEADPPRGKDSQPVATTRDGAAADSRASQIFAPFTEDSADRLRTLRTVGDVAAFLHVSTKMVYRLCERGELRHIRVLNAIRGSSIRRRGVRTRLPEWTTGTQLTVSPGFVRNREAFRLPRRGSPVRTRCSAPIKPRLYITGPGHTDG